MKLQTCIDLINSELMNNSVFKTISRENRGRGLIRYVFMVDDWMRIQVLYSARNGVRVRLTYTFDGGETWSPYARKSVFEPAKFLPVLRLFRMNKT